MASSPALEPVYLPNREVSPKLDLELRALFLEAFPHEAEDLKTRRYFRECPAHRWIIFGPHGQPIAHVAAHDKTFASSQGPIRAIGVAEVCVTASFRGRGFVRRILQDVHAWARSRDYPFSLLFGNIAVYRRSGYLPTTNVYRYWKYQTREWIEEPISGALALPLGDQPWPEGPIDLAGPLF
jgi:GNAT superfamily N-acetyltransferase